MYRRVVSLLLLPSFLLIQWASIGHVHGGNQSDVHDFVPHFHLNGIWHDSHGDQHHNNHGDQHHHQDDGDDEPDIDQPEPPETEPLSDHDADAVYLSVDLLLGARCQTSTALGGVTWTASTPDVWFDGWTDTQDYFACWLPAPPRLCWDSCPLYLQHVALLI
jgi:hypothetical protein